MIRTAILTALVAGAALVVAGCGGDTTAAPTVTNDAAIVETTARASTTGTSAGSAATPAFSGGTVSPVKAAPELGLRTWNGRRVTMADYKGKAVLVTFIYVNCPDICPLIVDNLVRVKDRLGADGKNLRIVAVSVDPVGDTPAAVKRFLTAHRALRQVDYLVGSRPQLEAVWARWGIGARVSKDNPSLVEHSGVIWGVDTKGRRATFYPATGFDVADIEGDVRLLLAQ